MNSNQNPQLVFNLTLPSETINIGFTKYRVKTFQCLIVKVLAIWPWSVKGSLIKKMWESPQNTDCNELIKCVSCGGGHLSTDKNCPKRKNKIQKVVTYKINNREARKEVATEIRSKKKSEGLNNIMLI